MSIILENVHCIVFLHLLYYYILLHVFVICSFADGSGMDFRTMLKKKKYAKHAADDQNPDWGGLKHHDFPDGEGDDGDGKVNKNRIYYININERPQKSPLRRVNGTQSPLKCWTAGQT
jgi:hypothetical protein